MSLTLAIQLGHNSTVAISNDLKILGSLSQEKIDNIKNSSSFPDGAIKNLCSYLDILQKYLFVVSKFTRQTHMIIK